MAAFFTSLNDWLWGNFLVAALVCCGLWFTWRTRFVQFRMIGEMIRLLGDSVAPSEKGKRHISSFEAFAVSVATRVGTGNMAGVATVNELWKRSRQEKRTRLCERLGIS